MTQTVEITTTYMATNDGDFDTRKRYMRKAVTSSTDFIVPAGPSIDAVARNLSGFYYAAWSWAVGPVAFVFWNPGDYGYTYPGFTVDTEDIAL